MLEKLKIWMLLCFMGCVCSVKAGDVVSSDTTAYAADFSYTLISGEKHTLYALPADWTLLYFYDPTCEDCLALMERLSESEVLNKLLSEKKLQVLAVYPEGDLDEWKAHAKQIPATWINGYDDESESVMNYLFRSFPALYLLDKDKKILLSETTADEVEKILVKK